MHAIKTSDNALEGTPVARLETLLADSYTLYLKTQNFHWNVTGPHFPALHPLFETQYRALAEAVDEIAERIRALGAYAPGSYRQFAVLSSIEEAGDNQPRAMEMVRQLASDHEAAAKTCGKLIEAAQAVGDEVSADLGIERRNFHEKTAWMLRATAA